MTEQELKRINDALTASATRGMVGGLLGLPVDLAATGLSLLGYQHKQPIGGSEWINAQMERAGLLSQNRYPMAEGLLSAAATAPLGVRQAVSGLYR